MTSLLTHVLHSAGLLHLEDRRGFWRLHEERKAKRKNRARKGFHVLIRGRYSHPVAWRRTNQTSIFSPSSYRFLSDKKLEVTCANLLLASSASSATPDAAAAVRNFLASLGGGQQRQQAQGKLYPLLSDLLDPSVTIPVIDAASEEHVDNLLGFLPPTVVVLSQQGGDGDFIGDPSPESIQAARETMSLDQKRSLLKKVLRSPQFTQSLASLTIAIRDGGLPTIAEALGIKVENGGLLRGGSMPLGGGEAVEAFVEGVKKTVQEERK